MLTPLMIGKKTFDSNLIQAPLAGVSCAPFRELVCQFGSVAYCCTEMLSALHIANDSDRSPRYQSRAPIEKNLCWQLSSNKPDVLARASEYAIKNKADILDLNCGCPQPKIRKKGCGSQLLADEKKLEEAGANASMMHGRHWTHDYDIACQFEAIANVVASVKSPVIGNGDINNAKDLNIFFENTQCAGFMIGRASVGQPWLFQQIACELAGKSFQAPTLSEVGKLFLQHVSGLIALDGERNAIFQSRKLGKYYARNIKNKNEFLSQLYEIDSFRFLEKMVQDCFA